MKCPACDRDLTERIVEDITVDVCEHGCGGIWFDWFELSKVDEKHEQAGEALLDVEKDPDILVDLERRRECPRCENLAMMRHYFSVKRRVTVDECPGCAGYWLDAGELAEIRNQFATEQERIEAAEKEFGDMLDSGLANIRERSRNKVEKARAVARMLRFICPSYYIPGDQDWGAF